MESLTGMIAFVRTAEHQSFVAAGRALGISASAVGKSVAKLEQDLGVRLLHRTTRRVALTEEGALFYERCRRILDDLREAEAMISTAADAPRGRLRVGLPTIGYRFLLPLIPEFRRRYPGIEIDIDFNDRIANLVDEGLDVVIRSGALSDSSLMSRRLAPFRFVLCASPNYLRARGAPQYPQDLKDHDCLRFRFPGSGRLQAWDLVDGEDSAPTGAPSPLTCNNMEAILSAAIADMGIAYMPNFLARGALEDGSLQSVLDEFLPEPGYFSILWPSSRHLSPRVRVFVDFVCDELFSQS